MSLHIPKIKAIKDVSFPNSTKKIKKWLEDVEDLEASVQVKEFYQLILKINRGGINAKEHIEILDLLRGKANFCVEKLEKKYLKAPLPLSEKSTALFKLAITLMEEMSLGYKLAATQLIEKNAFFSGSWITLSLNRILFYSNKLLLSYAQIYSVLPSTIWQDINATYQLAAKEKVLSKKIEDPFCESENISIEKQYKIASIFTISNPYGLRKGEAIKLFNSLIAWSKLVSIKTSLSKKHINYFSVDLEKSYAPSSMEKESASIITYIIFDDLIRKLDKQIGGRNLQKLELIQDDNLNLIALLRLRKNWVMVKNPRLGRKPQDSSIAVEVGLKHISLHLLEDLVESDDPFASFDEGEEDGESSSISLDSVPMEKTKKESQYATSSETDLKEIQDVKGVWAALDNGNVLTPQYERELILKSKERADLKSLTRDHVWTIQNMGTSGYSLRWTGSTSPSASVGEIIGLRSANFIGTDWHIAIIRWVQYRSLKEFNIGVETISNGALIANVSRPLELEEDLVRQSCLLLPAIKAIKQPVTLLLPAFMFTLGEELDLQFNDSKLHITITKIYEHTGSFTQFVIQYTGKNVVKGKVTNSLTEEVSNEFDSVWEKL